jgi:hypothetical protein
VPKGAKRCQKVPETISDGGQNEPHGDCRISKGFKQATGDNRMKKPKMYSLWEPVDPKFNPMKPRNYHVWPTRGGSAEIWPWPFPKVINQGRRGSKTEREI